jgi:hypothetical protein
MTEEVLTINASVAQQRLLVRVFAWMTLALGITALVALTVVGNPEWLRAVVSNRWLFFGIIIGQLALVMFLSAQIGRLSVPVASLMFLFYAVLNGVIFSVLFVAYTHTSIATAFFVTAGTFAVMSAYGYFTKADLSRFGQLIFMGLVGIILASLVNLFLKNDTMYWIITYVGVFIFIGLIAYDTQKIKAMAFAAENDAVALRKASLMGALALYLDFINLFLLILRFFGGRRN